MGALRIDRLTGPPAPLRDGGGRLLAARCYRAAFGCPRETLIIDGAAR